MRLGSLTVLVLGLAAAAPAQKPKEKVCPYCGNDPELLRRLDLVSHGPFPFAQAPKVEEGKILTSEDIQARIPFEPMLWLETRHFRIGSALGPYSVPEPEKKKIRAELERLKGMGLKNIQTTSRLLDPWLRLHLYAVRAEDLYTEFLKITRKSDRDFPAEMKEAFKEVGGKKRFMGQGPYLGEPEKFEIYIARSMRGYRTFMELFLGRMTVQPQRWNFAIMGKLMLGVAEEMEGYRDDQRLHNALAFNLGINFLDAYRFYAYNLPVWLTEGFGHFMERRLDPRYNSYDSNEGSVADVKGAWNYPPRVRFMVLTGTYTSMAEIFRRRDYGELKFEDHLIVWSIVEFLVNGHGDKFAALLDEIKGRVNEKGICDSTDLLGVQRTAMKEIFGWTPQGFEEAWKRHVLENYPEK